MTRPRSPRDPLDENGRLRWVERADGKVIALRHPWTKGLVARVLVEMLAIAAITGALSSWEASARWVVFAGILRFFLMQGARWTVCWRRPGELLVHEEWHWGTPTFGPGVAPDAGSHRIRLDAVAHLRVEGACLTLTDAEGREVPLRGAAPALRELRRELEEDARKARSGLADTPASAAARRASLTRLREPR